MRFGDIHGHWELESFPGCSQVVVSTHAFVKPHSRGHGIGTRTNLKKIGQAREMGYDYIMCTVVSTNKPQIRVMQKNGWKELDRFTSKVTVNEVILFGRIV